MRQSGNIFDSVSELSALAARRAQRVGAGDQLLISFTNFTTMILVARGLVNYSRLRNLLHSSTRFCCWPTSFSFR